MAIRDLLWACPLCEGVGELAPGDGGDVCSGCGARYRRGPAALIVAEPGQGGEPETRPATEWLDRLPDLGDVLDLDAGVCHEGDVLLRAAVSTTPVRSGAEYLGRYERFGDPEPGTLAVGRQGIAFRPEQGAPRSWPLNAVTGIQASSSTLQLKFHGEPVVSLRFPTGSMRFWETLMQELMRRHYRETGRGEIREFQPRIDAR